MTNRLEMNRREFGIVAAVVGGGMVLGLPMTPDAAPGDTEINPWIVINANDTITVRVPISESGTGVSTDVAAWVCEELSCEWSKVQTEFPDIQRHFAQGRVYQAYSFGRVKNYQGVGQKMGANARERLKAAAAKRWNVPAAQIEAKNGQLIHAASNRTLRYGEVAAEAATVTLAEEPKVKTPAEFTFAGKTNITKLTTYKIVNGTGVYGIDVKVPNMLYAAVRQSPVMGGKLKSFDANAIKDRPGVRAVVKVDPTPDITKIFEQRSALQAAVAVIADTWWQAKTALDVLPIEWDDGPGARFTTTDVLYKQYFDAIEKPADVVVRSQGADPQAKIGASSQKVEAVYMTPAQDHYLMEPINGTVMVTPDRVDVWIPTQAAETTLRIVADEVGAAQNKVYVHETMVGGAFGRRIYQSEARLAAAIAKQVPGRAVKMLWSREETTRQGRYRHMEFIKMQAVLGADGMPSAWFMRAASPSRDAQFGLPMQKVEKGDADGAMVRLIIDTPYWSAVPDMAFHYQRVDSHLLNGPWRGPGYNSNVFFLESFIDELAHAAKIDPVEYRRRMLAKWEDKNWLNVLNEAASKAGWGKPLPKGTAQGIAIGSWINTKPLEASIVAAVATVSVSPGGAVKVEQVDTALDLGYMINPSGVIQQVEGGTIFGLTAALYHEINVRNGRVVEANFDDSPMMRIDEAPKMLTHFGAMSGPPKFTEVGEPPVAPVVPAVTNAIFKITGKRIRTLPLKNHDLSWS